MLVALPVPAAAEKDLPPAGRAATGAEHTQPSYLQAKFAALAFYGVTATLMAELLPLGRPLHATAVRRQAQAVAERLEDELGPEHSPASSTAVNETGRRCPARTCPCSSASTVATSTPASNSPAGTGGSR